MSQPLRSVSPQSEGIVAADSCSYPVSLPQLRRQLSDKATLFACVLEGVRAACTLRYTILTGANQPVGGCGSVAVAKRGEFERLMCGRIGDAAIESGCEVSPAEPAKSCEARLGRVAPIVGEFRGPRAAVPDVAKTHEGRENEQEREGEKRQPQCPWRRRLARGLGWCHVNMLCHGRIRQRNQNSGNANPGRASPKGKYGFSNLPQIPWDSPRSVTGKLVNAPLRPC